jgi:hypothetical protein
MRSRIKAKAAPQLVAASQQFANHPTSLSSSANDLENRPVHNPADQMGNGASL